MQPYSGSSTAVFPQIKHLVLPVPHCCKQKKHMLAQVPFSICRTKPNSSTLNFFLQLTHCGNFVSVSVVAATTAAKGTFSRAI